MRTILTTLIILITINCHGFIENLSISTNSNTLILKWQGPSNYTEGSLYYSIYSTQHEPSIRNNKISDIEKFDLIGIIQYSTNNTTFSFSTSLFNRYYLIIPVTNGKSILDCNYNIIPPPNSLTKLSEKNSTSTNQFLTTNQQEPNPLPFTQSQEVISSSIFTNILSQTTLSPENQTKPTISSKELGQIIKEFFLKKDFKTSLAKLSNLLQTTLSNEEQDLIKIYIARCYYALNKKRKAIYILLSINSEEVKPLAEFWLDRYSKYFHLTNKYSLSRE